MENITLTKKDGERVFLDDALLAMEINLERTRNVLQDVTETFFGYDPETNDGKFAILRSFENYRIKTEIAFDYSFDLQKELESLQTLIDEVQHENTD